MEAPIWKRRITDLHASQLHDCDRSYRLLLGNIRASHANATYKDLETGNRPDVANMAAMCAHATTGILPNNESLLLEMTREILNLGLGVGLGIRWDRNLFILSLA